MKSYEFTAKNIEKAIEKGLTELNKKREEVDISILSEGGLFSKAKVVITLNEEETEKVIDAKEECNCGCEEHPKKEEIKEEKCDCEDKECHCHESHCDCGEDCECHKEEDCNCGCHDEECECDEECHCHHCECEHEDAEENKKPERVYLTSEQVYEEIENIFANIFKALDIDGKVMILENDEAYEVKVMGDEKVASLIGFRGEGLNAYQFLINNFLSLRNKSKKIYLDVENYRNKREESLKALAVRIAKKVLKTKRKHKFEPMTAYERHVIHEELSNFKGVTTHSEGNEPHRCLVVELDNNNN